MNTNNLIIIGLAILAVVVALIVARRSGGKPVAQTPPPAAVEKTAAPAPTAEPAPATDGTGVIDAAADAIADVAGPLLGVEANPDLPADTLTQIKGLGPKAAATLTGLGITRFDQLANLDADQVAALDAQLGAFKGRIARDRWLEQARLLAAGDTAGFEATFGKLGG